MTHQTLTQSKRQRHGKDMFKLNKITSEQKFAESSLNLIYWLRINHGRLEARYNKTLLK